MKRLFVIFLLCVSCAHNTGTEVVEVVETEVVETVAETAKPFTFGKGDIIHINPWKEPDFVEEVMVQLDGNIYYSILDDPIVAIGKTRKELIVELTLKLKEFINNPVVRVSFKSNAAIFVKGAVNKPGKYPMEAEMTAEKGILIAGGYNKWSSTKYFYINRNGKKLKLFGDGSDVFLKRGDVVEVPKNTIW